MKNITITTNQALEILTQIADKTNCQLIITTRENCLICCEVVNKDTKNVLATSTICLEEDQDGFGTFLSLIKYLAELGLYLTNEQLNKTTN